MEVSPVKLRELREERAYSIRELADKAGVHYNTVHRIEHGQENAHPRTIRLLAEALAIEPRELRHKQ
jgi:transcriptional regulator with XRE-family HTH domain